MAERFGLGAGMPDRVTGKPRLGKEEEKKKKHLEKAMHPSSTWKFLLLLLIIAGGALYYYFTYMRAKPVPRSKTYGQVRVMEAK